MIRHSPPSSKDVARRLIILKYVVVYGLTVPPRELLQQWMEAWPEDEWIKFVAQADQQREQHWGALRRSGLEKYLTPSERTLAQTTMLTITPQQHINTTWRTESAQSLMWVLGMIDDLPPINVQADNDLLKRIPAKDIRPFVKGARLRPSEEISEARGAIELWHWRSRTRRLIEEGRQFDPDPKLAAAGIKTFDDIVRTTAPLAVEDGTLDEIIDEDFAVDGKAYRDLSYEEWQNVRSITAERHFALNWTCGFAPGNRWDETPTDT